MLNKLEQQSKKWNANCRQERQRHTTKSGGTGQWPLDRLACKKQLRKLLPGQSSCKSRDDHKRLEQSTRNRTILKEKKK